ncbi:MAG: hypothetical protein HY558_06610 [Euryarchaeota archaeon]|nr:hypothetical protein [Euryarchaeota archaeon]
MANQGDLFRDLVERVTGKETALTLDLENVGLELGDRRITLNGRVNLSMSTLK